MKTQMDEYFKAIATFVDADSHRIDPVRNMSNERTAWVIRSTSRDSLKLAMANSMLEQMSQGKLPTPDELISLQKQAQVHIETAADEIRI